MRELSTAAKAAKAIRTELKTAFPGIKFFVKSRSYSGGTSVDVDWTNGPSVKSVEKIISKYQYGHFDGMTDMYEYSNKKADIPQAKFVFGNRIVTEEVKDKIRDHLIDNYSGWSEGADNNSYNEESMCYMSEAIYRFCQDKSIEEIEMIIKETEEEVSEKEALQIIAKSICEEFSIIKAPVNKPLKDYTFYELAAELESRGFEVKLSRENKA